MENCEIINPIGRIIVIGDLHGMLDETMQLLDKCKVTNDDVVIFLGDLIDRGPDNAGCVDLAMHRQDIQGHPSCILGNHEDKHLRYLAEEEAGKIPNIKIPSHIETRKQLTKAHFDFFKTLPLYIKLPEYNAICVHAGMYPGVKIEDQSRHNLLHIQMINPAYPNKTCWPSKVPEGQEGWQFWTNFWKGPERIIFGHSVTDKVLIDEYVVGIDGGSVFGEQQHALILPGWEIVSVQAQNGFGKGSRGRNNPAIAKFSVHKDVSTFS